MAYSPGGTSFSFHLSTTNSTVSSESGRVEIEKGNSNIGSVTEEQLQEELDKFQNRLSKTPSNKKGDASSIDVMLSNVEHPENALGIRDSVKKERTGEFIKVVVVVIVHTNLRWLLSNFTE